MTSRFEKMVAKSLKDHSGAEEVTRVEGRDHYGLPVFETETGEEYAIALDYYEARQAAENSIRESLWTFNASFICKFIGRPEAREGLAKMQETLCEDANEIIYLLIQADVDGFVEQAIELDGRGHFISPYDNKEIEFEGFLAYRIN